MKPEDFNKEKFEEVTGRKLETYAKDCHRASLAVVTSRLFKESRVVRGTANGVGGQHSWVVLSKNAYDDKATIIDPTLWSYRSDVDGVYVGDQKKYSHVPHGSGYFINAGMPHNTGGEVITLNKKLSKEAEGFLSTLGELDARGWMMVANLPVGGWPAKEIIEAMYNDNRLKAFVPVDIVGMVTDINPNGLYL